MTANYNINISEKSTTRALVSVQAKSDKYADQFWGSNFGQEWQLINGNWLFVGF